jgi:hypothetical protein
MDHEQGRCFSETLLKLLNLQTEASVVIKTLKFIIHAYTLNESYFYSNDFVSLINTLILKIRDCSDLTLISEYLGVLNLLIRNSQF